MPRAGVLGLALSSRIASLHGASLSFESEPGKGTVISVAFPPLKTGL